VRIQPRCGGRAEIIPLEGRSQLGQVINLLRVHGFFCERCGVVGLEESRSSFRLLQRRVVWNKRWRLPAIR
jgi:hypothetical protein